MCTWCGHDRHRAACPRTILTAAASIGVRLPRRHGDKIAAAPCPCKAGAA